MTFTIYPYKHGWIAWGHTSRTWSATAESKDAAMQMCREHVAYLTGRPWQETTITFLFEEILEGHPPGRLGPIHPDDK